MIKKLRNLLYDHYYMMHYSFLTNHKAETGYIKPRILIYIELLKWYCKHSERNKGYASWKLYQKGKYPREYIGRNEMMSIKAKAEKQLKAVNHLSDLDYDVLSKDKFVAGSYLSANGIPCVFHEGIVLHGQFHSVTGQDEDLASLIEREGELIFKENAREAGEGFLYVKLSGKDLYANDKPMNESELHALLIQGVWVVQKRVLNHEKIRTVNDSALNTTRIVTIVDGDQPVYLTGFQAFAAGGAKIDSWSKGSVYVGIDIENECLKDIGYLDLKDTSGSVTTLHPDTKVRFEGYHIPYLKEAVELCIKAHRLYYNNFIIGWDVAITDDGPLILEANEKPGMNAVQCVDGGLRGKILECYRKLKKEKGIHR